MECYWKNVWGTSQVEENGYWNNAINAIIYSIF